MIETLFNGCEDPELVDIEMELPQDEFGMLTEEAALPDLSLDFGEFSELGKLQEEFEDQILEDMPMDDGIDLMATEDEMPMIEEFEPAALVEDISFNMDQLIAALKKHPGLKITFSF